MAILTTAEQTSFLGFMFIRMREIITLISWLLFGITTSVVLKHFFFHGTILLLAAKNRDKLKFKLATLRDSHIGFVEFLGA